MRTARIILILMLLSITTVAVAADDFPLVVHPASQQNPVIASDVSGNMYLAWQDNRDGNWEIYFSSFNADGTPLAGEIRVTNTSGSSTIPDISVDSSGNSYLVWAEGSGVRFCKLDRFGNKLVGDITVASGSVGDNPYPSIATTPSGISHIVYERRVVTLYRLYYRKLDANGNSIGSEVKISENVTGDFAKRADASLDPSGNCYVAWRERDSSWNKWIYVCRITNNSIVGTIGFRKSDNAKNPRITAPQTDWIYLIYEDVRGATNEIYYVVGVNNDWQVSEAPGSSYEPALATDSSNHSYIAWEDNRNGKFDIYLAEAGSNDQKIGSDIKISNTTGDSRFPEICLSNGQYKVVWQDNRNGNWDIYGSFGGSAEPEKIPVILIPGIMGTYLYNDKDGDGLLEQEANYETDELIWLDDEICCNETDNYLDVLALKSDGSYPERKCDLDPSAECLIIAPKGIFSSDNHVCIDWLQSTSLNFYGPLIQTLESNGFQVYPLPYDWRKDIRLESQRLENLISEIRAEHPSVQKIDVVAHSMGGLLARYYSREHPEAIGTLVFLGTPHLGAPATYEAAVNGLLKSPLDILLNQEKVKSLVQNWPGAHELLPSLQYVSNPDVGALIQVRDANNSTQQATLQEIYGISPTTTLTAGDIVPNWQLNDSALQFHSQIENLCNANRCMTIISSDLQTTERFNINAFPGLERTLEPVMGQGDTTVPLKSVSFFNAPNQTIYYTKGINHTDYCRNEALAGFIKDRLLLGDTPTDGLPPFIQTTPFQSSSPGFIFTLSPTDWEVLPEVVDLACYLWRFLHIFPNNEFFIMDHLDSYIVHIMQCTGGYLNMIIQFQNWNVGFINIPFPLGTDGIIELVPGSGMPVLQLDYDGNGIFDDLIFPQPLPVILTLPPLSIGGGETYQYNVYVHPLREGAAIIFRLLEGPPGMTIDPVTGLITWIAICGDHRVVVEAEEVGTGTTQQEFDLHVEDTTPPSITPPPDISTFTNDPNGTAVDIGSAAAYDSCCEEISLTNDAPPVFPVGTTTVTWTAEDCNGFTTSAPQMVCVKYCGPPIITPPADVTVECIGFGGQAVNIGQAVASSECCEEVTLSNDAPALFRRGDTIVTWTATDCNGKSASATQTVHIVDTTPPVLTAPSDVTVECTGPSGQAVDIGQATASDICCGVTIGNNAPALFPFGDTVVTWTATDCAGNSSMATQTIHVLDTTPPNLTPPSNVPAECVGPDGQPVNIGQATASDICCGEVMVTNDAPAVFPIGETVVAWTATDCHGNSSTATQKVVVEDMTPPDTTIGVPAGNEALQDGPTLSAQASDVCGEVMAVYFCIREPGGANGIPIGQEDLSATLNTVSGSWERNFDTTLLQDGYYVILAKAVDSYGNEGWSELVPFSIRNWAVVELLPASENNKAGRTMPVKFALRIAAAVDPAQPFVYNEDLEIRIYDASKPGTILQSSFFGDSSTEYRIISVSELYITNFKTGPKPATYLVEIWRPIKNFLVGSFTFMTVK